MPDLAVLMLGQPEYPILVPKLFWKSVHIAVLMVLLLQVGGGKNW